MLKSLTLKNFRKHENLELNFDDGLTVIRGNSEAGKSTLGEAILYALFGAPMLRESLDMVVTYDQPENSLKVTLVFTIDGVDYKVVRGKSGAELSYGDQLVTGQRETRIFVERLLGCSANTAKLLMFADQGAVRGVLSEGGTAANGLVETLAQLGLIEELVDKVQSQLPSGNTKAIDAQIETLRNSAVEVPEMPSNGEILRAEAIREAFAQKISSSERSIRPDQEVAKALRAADHKKAVQAEITRLQARKAEIHAILAKSVAVPPFSLAELAQARADAANSIEQARRWKAAKTVFPKVVDYWEGDRASFDSFVENTELQVAELTSKIPKLEKSLTIAEMKRIKDKTCAFCLKDLTDVPEVTKINAEADSECARLSKELATLQSELKEQQATMKMLRLIAKTTTEIEKLAGDYWHLDYSCIPPKPVWKGEPATEPGVSNLPVMEKVWAEYEAAKVRREMLQAELAGIVLPQLPDTSAEEAMLKEQELLKQEIQSLKLELAKAENEVISAKSKYDAAVAAREAVIAKNAANSQMLADLVKTRDEMLKHNELIKKLRAARPEIGAKMWGTVLGAISRYFSQIRGEESVVVRTAEGFKVNGRSVAGLSGSTNDALGLAIRMALSKLFLPNVPFLLLDEAFAACDDNRELAGVSTLAAAGFSQIFLITHSSAPETLADTLLTL